MNPTNTLLIILVTLIVIISICNIVWFEYKCRKTRSAILDMLSESEETEEVIVLQQLQINYDLYVSEGTLNVVAKKLVSEGKLEIISKVSNTGAHINYLKLVQPVQSDNNRKLERAIQDARHV
ncbi:MAG: hypothetical protein KGJ35_01165 [Patescibacteria group bacterium]|nr:hypothetical protein [Patescibacteria group bacterium]